MRDEGGSRWEEFYAEFEQQYEKMKLGMHYRGVQVRRATNHKPPRCSRTLRRADVSVGAPRQRRSVWSAATK